MNKKPHRRPFHLPTRNTRRLGLPDFTRWLGPDPFRPQKGSDSALFRCLSDARQFALWTECHHAAAMLRLGTLVHFRLRCLFDMALAMTPTTDTAKQIGARATLAQASNEAREDIRKMCEAYELPPYRTMKRELETVHEWTQFELSRTHARLEDGAFGCFDLDAVAWLRVSSLLLCRTTADVEGWATVIISDFKNSVTTCRMLEGIIIPGDKRRTA